MRKYFSLMEWRDNSDGHLYREGEPFPFDGREIPKERLEALESGRNRAGLRLIQATDAGMEQAQVRKEEAPERASEGQKTATAEKKPKRRK